MRKAILGFLGIAYINATCGEGENAVGTLCLTDEEAQACFDHLDDLSAATEKGTNESISNVCEDLVVNDVQRYRFTVSYDNGYVHNADCNTQTIEFEGTPLTEGNGDVNQWEFDPVEQEITFDILHDDLVPTYGCELFGDDDDEDQSQFIWQCDMELNILLGGIEQLTYSFFITITMDRVKENELSVTVTKNEVVGDCCENVLNIETALNFCTDFTCSSYLPDGLVIERKSDIFVEHSIVTPEFDYYFLHGLQIKLGPFVPEIIDTDGSQAGRLIYHFQSNIAMDDMILECISRIDENPMTVRRMLANEEIGDDYKLKAEGTISVQEAQLEKKEGELKEEKEDNQVLIGVLAGMGALVFLSLAGALFYCLKVKSQKQQQPKLNKYKEENVESQA